MSKKRVNDIAKEQRMSVKDLLLKLQAAACLTIDDEGKLVSFKIVEASGNSLFDGSLVATLGALKEVPKPHGRYDSVETTVAATFVAPLASETGVLETKVNCIDLAEFIRGLPAPVKLLKMDIEGAEIAVLNHLIDTGIIDRVDLAVVETHERLSEDLSRGTEELRGRLNQMGLEKKIRLDWI